MADVFAHGTDVTDRWHLGKTKASGSDSDSKQAKGEVPEST